MRNYREQFGKFVEELCAASGEVILGHYAPGAGGLAVECKADASPVTAADREAELLMRRMIRERFPGHGVVAEEFGNEREDAEFVWVLDPIDGTVSFVAGCPLFGTLVGLMHQGAPVLGAIHQPVTRQLCIGDGEVTTLNGRVVRVGSRRSLSEAFLCSNDLALIERHQDIASFNRLRSRCRIMRGWGDCYGYLLLASGGIDIMLDPVVNPWDILPVIPIVTGAGGAITAWDGGSPVAANSCVASNPALHPQVLAMLGGRAA